MQELFINQADFWYHNSRKYKNINGLSDDKIRKI